MDLISREDLLNKIFEDVPVVTDDMQLIIDLIRQQPKVDKVMITLGENASETAFYFI